MRRTKIVCTMGPNTNSRDLMKKLIETGMDVARFNFSHGDHDEQKMRMDMLKELRKELKTPVAILLDTKGPEIRTGVLKDGKKVNLVTGQTFTLTTVQETGDENHCSVSYTGLTEDIKEGDTILIDDGLIGLRVEKVNAPEIVCTVVNGGELGEKKGVNVPNVSINLPNLTEKDKGDLLFGIEQDIDFVAEPGKTTAIIGSTGCGKSTLVNLLPRFYDVTGGEITLDGTDIRKYTLQDLREHIGFVPQKGILFSGTIASNLRFGAEDASDEQIREAAEIAQAIEFIDSKQDGYESAIAQGGSNVSGGQKQRLAIARAIAKNPKIYVFDDSFSALDMKTDAALRRALETKTEHTTVIIVAQRISTILHADQILVLDDGKIVGKGTHEELLHNCEVYEQIARSQLSAKELGLSEEVK